MCGSTVQVLHDAFFKHQTKPPLTSPGDLYYEGKEFEAKNQEHKPGNISPELREVRSLFCKMLELGLGLGPLLGLRVRVSIRNMSSDLREGRSL